MRSEDWKEYTREREEALRNGTLVISEEEKAEMEQLRKETDEWLQRPNRARQLRELINSLAGRIPDDLLNELRETGELVIKYSLKAIS